MPTVLALWRLPALLPAVPLRHAAVSHFIMSEPGSWRYRVIAHAKLLAAVLLRHAAAPHFILEE